MTPDDTIDLLGWVQGFDGRTIGRVDIATWQAVSSEARWSLPEARDAVTRWYAYNTGWITPGAITAGIKVIRDEQHRIAEQAERAARPLELEAGPNTRPRPVEALLRRLGRLPAPAEPDDAGPPMSWSVPCPYCRAAAGSPCTRPSRRGPVPAKPHPSRHDAMATANGLP